MVVMLLCDALDTGHRYIHTTVRTFPPGSSGSLRPHNVCCRVTTTTKAPRRPLEGTVSEGRTDNDGSSHKSGEVVAKQRRSP